MQLPLTCFTSIANKSVWAAAVKAIRFINTRSIVETGVTVAFIDGCNNRNHNNLKTQVIFNCINSNSLQIACNRL